MKNLLLIAFATLALSLGANVLNACPDCEGKTTVSTEKKVAKTDAKTDVKTEKVVVEVKSTETTKQASNSVAVVRASAGQVVKCDKDCSGSCSRAAAGQATKAEGGCCGGAGCGEGCCGGCDKSSGDCGSCDKSSGDCGSCDKAEKKDCEGCKTSEKTVKN